MENNIKELKIKEDYLRFYDWLKIKCKNELGIKSLFVYKMKILLHKNDYINLMANHLYNIRKIIVGDMLSFDGFIYNMCWSHDNENKLEVIHTNIEKRNYKVLDDLINHKQFYTFKCCYEKDYYNKDKLATIKLDIS